MKVVDYARAARCVAGAMVVCFGLFAADLWAFLRPAAVPEDAPAEESGATAPVPGSASAPVGMYDSYDRSNPDFAVLQRSETVLKDFPVDLNGAVDWVGALRSGVIQPREVLNGSTTYLPLDLDVVMRNTKAMPYVRFPHKTHTEWLACSNCHPGIFLEKAGSTRIRMEDIFRGKYCGTCHDRVAFITHRGCFRCHSVPQPAGAAMP